MFKAFTDAKPLTGEEAFTISGLQWKTVCPRTGSGAACALKIARVLARVLRKHKDARKVYRTSLICLIVAQHLREHLCLELLSLETARAGAGCWLLVDVQVRSI